MILIISKVICIKNSDFIFIRPLKTYVNVFLSKWSKPTLNMYKSLIYKISSY